MKRSELKTRIENSISQRDLAIVGLYYYRGYTDQEIGHLLGMKRKTVASAKSLALKKLKKIYMEASNHENQSN